MSQRFFNKIGDFVVLPSTIAQPPPATMIIGVLTIVVPHTVRIIERRLAW